MLLFYVYLNKIMDSNKYIKKLAKNTKYVMQEENIK